MSCHGKNFEMIKTNLLVVLGSCCKCVVALYSAAFVTVINKSNDMNHYFITLFQIILIQ